MKSNSADRRRRSRARRRRQRFVAIPAEGETFANIMQLMGGDGAKQADQISELMSSVQAYAKVWNDYQKMFEPTAKTLSLFSQLADPLGISEATAAYSAQLRFLEQFQRARRPDTLFLFPMFDSKIAESLDQQLGALAREWGSKAKLLTVPNLGSMVSTSTQKGKEAKAFATLFEQFQQVASKQPAIQMMAGKGVISISAVTPDSLPAEAPPRSRKKLTFGPATEYRIHLGLSRPDGSKVENETALKLISREFPNASVTQVSGFWRGTREPSLVISIVSLKQKDLVPDDLWTSVQRLKRELGQDAVLVVRTSGIEAAVAV